MPPTGHRNAGPCLSGRPGAELPGLILTCCRTKLSALPGVRRTRPGLHAEARLMRTIPVPAGQRPRVLGPGIAILGAATVPSPDRWLEAWRAEGFSLEFVPFHLRCWAPSWSARMFQRRGRDPLRCVARSSGRRSPSSEPMNADTSSSVITRARHATGRDQRGPYSSKGVGASPHLRSLCTAVDRA